MTTEIPTTHQQRWRSRLRETHDRIDIYLPKALAKTLRLSLSGDDSVSTAVERALRHALCLDAPVMTTQQQAALEQAVASLPLSPEAIAFARSRAAIHGVPVDDFILAAMHGVQSQTVIMIRGLAIAGRREALAELESHVRY